MTAIRTQNHTWRALCGLVGALLLAAPVRAELAAIKPSPVKPLTAEAVELLHQHLDLVYAQYGAREMHLDLFRPKNATGSLPAILVVHGGGWVQGDKSRFRALAQSLALRGYVTAAIEYRLADEAKFPAAVQDCHAAVRWLRANAKEHGINPDQIGAVGGSAGGHLVGLVATAPALKELQGDGGNASYSSQLQAAVVLAGPFDLTTGPVAERSRQNAAQSFTNRWLGKSIDEAPDLYRLASPFTHLSKTTPPVLFLHGELDRPEQNLASRRRLAELGVPTGVIVYKAGKHGCWNQHPWFEAMLDDIDVFLATILQQAPPAQWPKTQRTEWGEIRFGSTGLELHVARRPAEGSVEIPRLNNPVAGIYRLGDEAKSPLKLSPGIAEWSIELPPPTGDEPLVITMETLGRPHVPAIPRVVNAATDNSLTLSAHDAVTHGVNLRYEPQPHKNTVGYWTNAKDWCEWHCYLEQPGVYEVHVLQGCGKGQGGSEVAVLIDGQELTFVVEDTGHFQNFKDRSIGTISLTAPRVHTLQLRPRTKAGAAVMDVRQIRLIPVGIE